MLTNAEDLIDWNAIPGSEWYRPGNVARSIACIRNREGFGPDILYQIANNHAGELYPAAVTATSILLEIVLESNEVQAATKALCVIDTLVWFRGEAPFKTTIYQGVEVPLEQAIWLQVQSARPQLMALIARDKRLRKIVLSVLESLDQSWAE